MNLQILLNYQRRKQRLTGFMRLKKNSPPPRYEITITLTIFQYELPPRFINPYRAPVYKRYWISVRFHEMDDF